MGDVTGTRPLAGKDRPGSGEQLAGELGHAQGLAGALRWMLSARFCWGLAGAVLLLNLTSAAIIAAGRRPVPAPAGPKRSRGRADGAGWWRPAVPVTWWASLLAGDAITGAVALLTDAYAQAAVLHFHERLPFATQAMWMTAWDFVPASALAWSCRCCSPMAGCCRRGGVRRCGPRRRCRPGGGWQRVRAGDHGRLVRRTGRTGTRCPARRWAAHRRGRGLALVTAAAAAASVAQRWRRAGHVERRRAQVAGGGHPAQRRGPRRRPVLPRRHRGRPGLRRRVGHGVRAGEWGWRCCATGCTGSSAGQPGGVYGLLTVAVAGVYLAAVAVAGVPFDPGRG